MNVIRCITGDIAPKELGWCQSHEHLFIAKGSSWEVNHALLIDDYKKSVEELMLYKAAGGMSIVDAQPYNFGRMAQNLFLASKEASVNIIASTGFHKLEFIENKEWLNLTEEDKLGEFFADEIQFGMHKRPEENECTGKAGVIKCALIAEGFGQNKLYKKLFEAAAFAAKKTGASLLCHVDSGADVLKLIAFFIERKIPPNKLIFCHLDRTHHDFAYHLEVLKTGAYLEYDTIHRLKYHSDEQEIKLIQSVVEAGFTDQLLLSLDTTRERLKSYGGVPGLDYILQQFKQMLAEKKVSAEKFMKDNPKKAFAIN